MVTFHSGGPTFGRRYSVLQDRWLPSAIAIENDFQGVGAVLDPDSGIVYITGGYTTRDMMSIYDFATDSIREAGMLPAPEFTLRARSYYGHTTTGFAPAMRADLCMAINDDGTKIVIFGGTLSSNLSYANDIFIIDLLTMTWRQGTSGLYRAYASCTMAGNQLIVWGGVDQAKRMVDNTILLYDIDHNAWGTSYTPPLSYVEIAKNQTNQIPGGTAGSNNESGGSSGGPNTGSSSSSKSHAGVIAAGVVGGLAVICAVALLCIFYKRKSPDAINTKKTKRRGIGGQESGTTELRDRKYSNEVAQNDEELQNLRQQVQNREEELELRRRLLQLQQEQQQHLLLQAQQVQHRQQECDHRVGSSL
ncbi:hypothetical protein BGZ83_000010 [Gryganskiella cystojenkinii]|nr:hypothetical protein BGZ83_000010 [Gryganskiella cystojenkinii]